VTDTVTVQEENGIVVVQETVSEVLEVFGLGPQGAQGEPGPQGDPGDLTPAATAAKVAAEDAAAAALASQTSATSSAASASGSATAAATKAAEALASASSASSSAGTATTKATEATNAATSATGSASTASAKANEATTAAATATAKASEATTGANTATTKASEAAVSASSASGSATTATSQATIATTKASEASTSASNAAGSATAAAASAATASTGATTATTQATAASSSATAAQTSATNAASSATSATASKDAAAVSATTATTKASEASASATSAQTSATTATTQAGIATDKATEAATSATAAAGSATSASGSATTATTQAADAASSATAAEESATSAASSKNDAEMAAVTSTTQAGIATTKASEAATSATTASTKASEASTSATSASTSAGTATTQAGIATTKAEEAASSATSAVGSASTATTQADLAVTKASEASTSATNAAASATTAASSATAAAGSATTATTQAGVATTKASEAAASASTATTKASEASSSASDAASAKNAAEAARDQTLSAFDSFDDRYLGQKSSDPTVDNDGDALVGGSLYFNTNPLASGGGMKVYDAINSSWLAAYASLSGALISANNLSDLASASASRINIGLGDVENKSSATIRSEITSGNVTTALGFTPYNATNPTGFITSAALSPYLTSATAASTYQPIGAYLTGITSSQVTTALGFTPYNATNPSGYITSSALSPYLTSATAASTYQPIGSYLTGITSSQVTTALGFTPYNATNPTGYITSAALSGYLTSATAATTYQPLDGDLTSIAGLAGTSGFLKKTSANTWALDTNTYLTSFTETDPVFVASPAYGVTSTNITNWNTAYGWGNHASAGYLTGITSGQVTTALGFTPYNSTNPSGFITSSSLTPYLTSATAASTYQPIGSYLTGITSGQVTTALGFTPYNASNPSGYITSSALTSYLTSATAASTYQPIGSYLTAITSGNVTTALGFTPANKAGDTFTGNVGIGKDVPSGPLHVKGANGIYVEGAVNTNVGRMVMTGGSNEILAVGLNGVYAGGRVKLGAGAITPANGGWIDSFADGQHLFYGPSSTEHARLTAAGFFGIGTATPSNKLTVQGAIDTYAQVATTAADGIAGVVLLNDARSWVLRNNGTNGDAFEIRDATANAQRLVITAAGNATFSHQVTATQFNGSAAGLTGLKTVNGNSVIGSGNIQIDGGVTSFNTRTGAITLGSGDVTTALGFTPYNATNPSGFISGINSSMVTTALGFTPYNSSNPSEYVTTAGARSTLSFTAGSGAYNSTTGVITIPTNTNQLTNGAGFTTNTGTVTSVAGTGTVSGLTLTGTVTGSGSLTLGGTLSLTSGQVTTALGFTPGTGDVTTTGTQTLTNKTLTSPTLTTATATGITLNDGYTEEVFLVSGNTPAFSPNDGSIQFWAPTASPAPAPTAGTWAAGQSITLMINGGGLAIDWSSMNINWKTGGGTAPEINDSGLTAIALWKVGAGIYGARVGDA
jgi:hypothetical protein